MSHYTNTLFIVVCFPMHFVIEQRQYEYAHVSYIVLQIFQMMCHEREMEGIVLETESVFIAEIVSSHFRSFARIKFQVL